MGLGQEYFCSAWAEKWSESPLLCHPLVWVRYLTLVYSLCVVSCLTLWVAWLSISCQAESNCRLSSSRSLSSARAMVSFAARRISMARWNSCVALWASTWACRRKIKARSQSWSSNMPNSQNKALISSFTCVRNVAGVSVILASNTLRYHIEYMYQCKN